MLREEFNNLIMEVRPQYGPVHLTDRQWQLIDTVYTYHPSIQDKKHMVLLYLDYGMAVITDMYLRALKLRDMERQIKTKEAELERLQRIYDDFDNADSIAVAWEDLHE